MAKLTIELLEIVEMYTDDDKSIIDRISESAPKIFDFPYPIWDEGYRQTLNTKIIAHYIRDEISAETIGLWKLNMWRKMNEIMPYYNELYLTTLEKFDPKNEIDLTTLVDRKVAGSNDDTSSGTTIDTNENLGKDYPQAVVNGADSQFYGSQGSSGTGKSEGKTERHSENEGKEDAVTTRKGRTGARTQADLITSFREAIINIDVLIIEELRTQFTSTWYWRN